MSESLSHMRCGLLGEHLGHSFSAIIHNKIADYSYELCEVAPDGVEEFVKCGGLDAFNVTIPYKKSVMPYLDRISDEALRIGAVNTVVRRADGSLDGYNTDYFGFDRMLMKVCGSVKGKKALILGSGGASATVRAVLSDRGADPVVVVGRRLENNYENITRHADAQIIVNTTPVGMYPNCGESPVSLSLFPHCEAVLDIIYNPAKTALLLEAEKLGIPGSNGLYMLVSQAVRAYELFTLCVAEPSVIDSIVSDIAFDTRNIILVGMPGCGKSVVGKRIATILDRPFVDADEAFAKMHGATPAEVISERGEEEFRALEHKTLCEICKVSGAVIATGGGAVTRGENYDPMHQNGVVVYLRRELSRLSSEGRPLSQRVGVEALFESRRALYESFADITVDSTEEIARTARLVIEKIKEGM